VEGTFLDVLGQGIPTVSSRASVDGPFAAIPSTNHGCCLLRKRNAHEAVYDRFQFS
jgi:hypothetical protein